MCLHLSPIVPTCPRFHVPCPMKCQKGQGQKGTNGDVSAPPISGQKIIQKDQPAILYSQLTAKFFDRPLLWYTGGT
jgi:hypothetical protein